MSHTSLTAIKWTLAVAAGGLSAWWGQQWPLLLMVAAALVLDYVTGLLAAAFEGTLCSRIGWRGILKKVGSLLLMLAGLGLDAAIPVLVTNGLELSLNVSLPFGLIIASWIVLNEALSVMENLYRAGVPIPAGLVKLLRIAKESVDSGVDGSEPK